MVPDTTPAPKLTAPARAITRKAVLNGPLNLPNLITLARLLSVPVAIWLIVEERYGAAFWLFVAAGASDALDGFIAKRFDRRTRLGAILDPAADKALLAGVYITLGVAGQLPPWLVILVIVRDFLIVLGFVVVQTTASPRHLGPLYVSKINTLVQLFLVGFVLAQGLGIQSAPVKGLLVAAAAATTVLSGLSYLMRLARLLARSEQPL